MNYYNEYDKKAAAWLVELIKQGHIAPGIVDERSINDVQPGDLAGFTQCHFFAGIGVWSYALRRAGWPDDRPVWTGSCPCQPFSNAGGRAGFADERHLWPALFQLIAQRRPPVFFGEQVASKDGLAWFDLVHADLEAARYAVGAADLCAAGVGAPHIRQRLWFVGSSTLGDAHRAPAGPGVHAGRAVSGTSDLGAGSMADAHRDDGAGRVAQPHGWPAVEPDRHGADGSLADTQRPGLQVRADGDVRGTVGYDEGRLVVESGHGGVRVVGDAASGGRGEFGHAVGAGRSGHADSTGLAGGLADANGGHPGAEREQRSGQQRLVQADGSAGIVADTDDAGRGEQRVGGVLDGERQAPGYDADGRGAHGRPGPTNGHWASPDWIFCRDNKWRPVEPGSFPLVNGAPERVGLLRGFGNAIVAEVAETFIAAYLDVEGGGLTL